MFGTSSLGTTAQEPFRTSHQLIPGQPESIVVGSIQQLSLLTVDELMHPDPNLPALLKAPPVSIYRDNGSVFAKQFQEPSCMVMCPIKIGNYYTKEEQEQRSMLR